ncbi:Fc.00g097170.m01.CDS01 [Cosmosporella sp. VM-42]
MSAVENEDYWKLVRRLQDRRHPDTCLPGSNLTPLHRALTKGWFEGALVLVLAGADEGFNYNLIKLMCELGADVNASNRFDITALHFAVVRPTKDGDIKKALIAHGSDIDARNSDGWTPLWDAVADSQLTAARQLLDYGCDPNARNFAEATPLMKAVGNGAQASLEMRGPDGFTALHDAVFTRADVVPYLLEHGADVNVKKNHGAVALHMAAHGGRPVSVLECLLKAGSLVDPVTPTGHTPLFLAAAKGNIEAMKVLIDHGAYLDCEADMGETPLVGAVSFRHFDAARLLIQSGADIDVPAYEIGLRGIHVAAMEGLDDLVRLFLDQGADIVVCYAFEQPAMLRFLLSLGLLDVNHQGNHGTTALHHAVISKSGNEMAAARALLQKGARQFLADEYWEDYVSKQGFHKGTPAEVAREMGKTELAELIENWKYDS